MDPDSRLGSPSSIIHPDARPLRIRPLRLVAWVLGVILLVVGGFWASWAILPGIVALIVGCGPYLGTGSGEQNVE